MAKSSTQKRFAAGLGVAGKMKNWHAIAIISVIVGFFFRDILLQKAFFWEDFIYQYYAFRNFASVSLAHGELPLWNPYTFSGMPFQADIQTALFYIPNLLLTFFAGGERLHFYWVELLVVIHFIIAGCSMYVLSKDFGLDKPYALFSGLVYALSGFMITHAIHYTFICQVAWTPLVLLFFRKGLLERSVAAMILSGLILGNAILGGSPQFTLYIFLFLLAYFLFEFISSVKSTGLGQSWQMLPLAAGTIIIALAVTAVQLLPTIELGSLSQRAEITFEKSAESSLAWEQLLILVVPKYFGDSGAQGSNYWFAQSYWDYWETCLYIGIPGLLAVLSAIPLIKKNRYVGFFFGVILFSLLYALGKNFFLHSFFFHAIPGFDKFRIPGRMSFLFTLSAALLSGFGCKYFFENILSESKSFVRWIAGLFAIGLFAWILAQSGAFLPQNAASEIQKFVMNQATTAFILVILTCALFFVTYKKGISIGVALIMIILLQVVDIHLFGFSQNNGKVNPEEYYGRTKDLVSFLKAEGQKEYFRINARDGGAMLLDRNQGMVDRIFMMEGYTPLSLQRIFTPGKDWSQTCDLLNAKYRINVDEQRRTMNMATSTTYLPRTFMVYDANVFESDSLAEVFMRSGMFEPSRSVVFTEQPDIKIQDTAYTSAWKSTITSYTSNTISVSLSTPKDGYLVLSEIYYPGWKAYVDGVEKKVYRANWNLRAICVPAGSHSVEVTFAPESFSRGMWISFAGLFCSVVGLILTRIRKPSVSSSQARE